MPAVRPPIQSLARRDSSAFCIANSASNGSRKPEIIALPSRKPSRPREARSLSFEFAAFPAVEETTFQCARPWPASPFPWPRRARNLSIERRLDWRRDHDRSAACSKAALSRQHRASRMSSTGTGREQPGGLRKAGAPIAHASDAHEARIARFSLRVRSGSLTTSRGRENAPAGCRRSSSSRSNGLFGELRNEGFFIATSSVEHMDTKCRRMLSRIGLSS